MCHDVTRVWGGETACLETRRVICGLAPNLAWGTPSGARNAAREAGYTDEQIIEIVATVAFATYSNYLNDTMQTEMDIPVREPLGSR